MSAPESNRNPGKRNSGVTTSQHSQSTVSPTKTKRKDLLEQEKLDENEPFEELEPCDEPNVCKRCKKPLKNLIIHLQRSKGDCKDFYDLDKPILEQRKKSDEMKKLKNKEYNKTYWEKKTKKILRVLENNKLLNVN